MVEIVFFYYKSAAITAHNLLRHYHAFIYTISKVTQKKYIHFSPINSGIAVVKYVRKCKTCQSIKVGYQTSTAKLQPLKVLEWKWNQIILHALCCRTPEDTKTAFIPNIRRSYINHNCQWGWARFFSCPHNFDIWCDSCLLRTWIDPSHANHVPILKSISPCVGGALYLWRNCFTSRILFYSVFFLLSIKSLTPCLGVFFIKKIYIFLWGLVEFIKIKKSLGEGRFGLI